MRVLQDRESKDMTPNHGEATYSAGWSVYNEIWATPLYIGKTNEVHTLDLVDLNLDGCK